MWAPFIVLNSGPKDEVVSPFPPTSPLSIAPMVDRTHRHFRAFFRRLTRRTLLYTEMLTTGAILRGDPKRVLEFSSFEGPVALQVVATSLMRWRAARSWPSAMAIAKLI